MRNVLEQLIALYPDTQMNFILDDGRAISATPQSISADGGTLVASADITTDTQLINIDQIASIEIPNQAYSDLITYLSVADPLPDGSDSQVEQSFRALLPVGTQATIYGAGTTLEIGSVIRDEYGVIVLENANANPVFISTQKISSATIS